MVSFISYAIRCAFSDEANTKSLLFVRRSIILFYFLFSKQYSMGYNIGNMKILSIII